MKSLTTVRPLTDKQKFALDAVSRGIVKARMIQIGGRQVRIFYGSDGISIDVTNQVKSLLKRKLIRWSRTRHASLENPMELTDKGIAELKALQDLAKS